VFRIDEPDFDMQYREFCINDLLTMKYFIERNGRFGDFWMYPHLGYSFDDRTFQRMPSHQQGQQLHDDLFNLVPGLE
jgi:hypothetical protein